MMLYVNGDSHTAGAEAVNAHAFAEDDPHLFHLGRLPHPENLAVTWGKLLSLALNSGFHCDAESGCSNDRIIRTTREWLEKDKVSYQSRLIVIQWSTWEREEWLHDDTYYQVGASGLDHVPSALQEKYRNFIVGIDYQRKTQEAHEKIWQFHCELKQANVKHIFFNGNNHFGSILDKKDWGNNYIDPYDPAGTYDSRIKAAGIQTVSPNSWHFGRDGHAFWNRFMLNYIMTKGFI